MKAIKIAGLVAVLLVSSTMAASTVNWNAKATAVKVGGGGGAYNLATPIDKNALIAAGVTAVNVTWTVYVDVSGTNQGLAGAVVSMGIKNNATSAWAPATITGTSLGFVNSYKSIVSVDNGDGTYSDGAVRGTIDASAMSGGVGASKGANKGSIAAGIAYVDQMGMGYLDWSAHVFNDTGDGGTWIGDQQWGVGMSTRKSTLLWSGAAGTYDLVKGTVNVLNLPVGTYSAAFDLPKMSSKVLNTGIDLNMDWQSVPMTEVAPTQGTVFSFTVVPEPATMLLLAGAGLLFRRRRA